MSNVVHLPASGRGNFFAIDKAAWAKCCGLDSMNPAVVYLVLARGSGADQCQTRWSIHAVETRTGISRPRAQLALAALIKANLVRIISAGTKPSYRIEQADQPELIWLPNSLIDGAAGETPPIELLRQTRNLAALRLFIELYGAHDLAANGGIHWLDMCQKYTRERVGESGPFIVFGFKKAKFFVNQHAPFVRVHVRFEHDGHGEVMGDSSIAFREALRTLTSLGLMDFIAHLIEADTNDADVIHPVPIDNGEQAERLLANAAHEAGVALLAAGRAARAERETHQLVPVPAHRRDVQLVGIARLRYRPRTSATAAWWARMEDWEAMAEQYRQIECGAETPVTERRFSC